MKKLWKKNGTKAARKIMVKLTAAAGCRESICMALCDSNINWIILERRRRNTRMVDIPSPKTQHFIKMPYLNKPLSCFTKLQLQPFIDATLCYAKKLFRNLLVKHANGNQSIFESVISVEQVIIFRRDLQTSELKAKKD